MIGNDKIILYPISESDIEDIVRWRNQEFVKQRFIYREDFTVDTQKEWLEKQVNTGKVVQFIVEYKKDGKRIGSVYLRDIDVNNHKAEFGIFLGEQRYMGKGIGYEAIKLLLSYAFCDMQLNKVYLRVLADNIPAILCYEKAGFRKEGYFEQDVMIEGEYRDVIFMGICENQYHHLTLRRAADSDCDLLFAWANDAETRKNSFNTAMISYEEHIQWFKRKQKESSCQIFILLYDGKEAGQIRLDWEGDSAEIGYVIAPEYRGLGFGTEILRLVEKQAEGKMLIGRVKKDNKVSGKCFLKNGYAAIEKENWTEYRKWCGTPG